MPSFFKKIKIMPSMKRANTLTAWSYLIFSVFLFVPVESQAAVADTFGQIICNAKDPGSFYTKLLSAIGYVIGVFLVLRGVLLLKKNSDTGGQTSSVVGIAHLLAGGALFALPSFTLVIQETLFSGLSGSAGGCSPGGVASGAQGLDVMMQNFVKNIHNPIFSLIAVLGYVIGATFIFTGLLRMAKAGTDPRAANPKDIIVLFVIGSVLLSISSALPIMLSTLFGSPGVSSMTSFQGIDWSGIVGSGANTAAADNTIKAILAFVQIVGGIAFLRGWLLVKKATEGGQATIAQAATHIIGGAMAINIDVMLKIIDTTFGTGLIN